MKMRFLIAAIFLLNIVAFASGPKYKKPEVETPQSWQSPVPWQPATPLDALPKDTWWKLFNDSELNEYEQRAMASNQTLKAAAARLTQARAFARVTASGLYPELDAGVNAQRQRLSANRPTNGASIVPTAVTQCPNQSRSRPSLRKKNQRRFLLVHNGNRRVSVRLRRRLSKARPLAAGSVLDWEP